MTYTRRALTIKEGPLLAILAIVLISVVSCVLTVFDPTAEWDSTIMSLIWMIGLTIAVVVLFSFGAVQTLGEWTIVMAAWVVRVLYATVNNSGVVTFRGDPFFEMGHALYYGYNHLIGDTYPVITNYPPLLLQEFKIFGINRLVTCYLNAFLTMIAIFFMWKCFKLLKINKRITTILMVVFSFNIFSILFGAEVFREAIYLPLVAISLFFFIKWTMELRPLHIVLAMAAILPIAWLHSGYIVIVGGYALVGLLHLKKITSNRLVLKMILLIGIVGAVLILLLVMGGGEYLTRLKMIADPSSFASYFDLVQDSINSNSGSQYLAWMSGTTSIVLLLLYTPIRMFYFLYSPMIWDSYRVQDLISFVTDSIVFLVALVLILKFIINREWRVDKLSNYNLIIVGTIVIVLLTTIPFAWGTFNAGTALRHRNCLLPFVCIQIGICLTLGKNRLEKNKSLREGMDILG